MVTKKEEREAPRRARAAEYDREYDLAVHRAVQALRDPQPHHIRAFVEIMREVDKDRTAEALAVTEACSKGTAGK